MRNLLTASIVASGLLGWAVPGHAQRPPGGRPNLSGVWIAGGFAIDGDKPAPPPPPGSAPIRREPPPYKTEAAAKMKELASNNANDPAVHCLLLGVPRSNTWPFPLEIVQTPEKVVILYEAMRAYRVIPIGAKHPDPSDLDPSFMGTSVGRWEGETLVVDTIGFNDKTWLGPPGSHHSDQLRVTERLSLGPQNTLRYEAVAEDPVVFTKPWTVTTLNYRHFPNPNERLREYECLEDNQDVQHLVPASRR